MQFYEANKMTDLESNKNLTGIGSILLIFPVVSIIGIILVYIGIKGLSDYYKEPGIYENALRGLIFGIIVLVAIAASIPLMAMGGIFSNFGFGLVGFGIELLTIFLALVIVFIFYFIAAMYFKKHFLCWLKERVSTILRLLELWCGLMHC
jgi:uncharacterized membrane protein